MDEQQSVADEEQSAPPGKAQSAMHARTWAIAAAREPAAYGIPELPDWRLLDVTPGMALAEEDQTEPFISAEQPMTVRR
ncbi:hypothetical protein [Halovenus sp. HT40]|uniref:hypothetical protein n=1 Tax=Halovenus sp. HT40 TaxID=3126691 RepID=UPI00300EAF89